MPGNQMTPSLPESWTVSPDQRGYEFKVREGLKLHNGDPFAAEDIGPRVENPALMMKM
jgi:peptide/nickel transport system substrate-binding protein